MTRDEATASAASKAHKSGQPVAIYRHRMDGRFLDHAIVAARPTSSNWEDFSTIDANGAETLAPAFVGSGYDPHVVPPPVEIPVAPAVFPSPLDVDISSIKDGIDIIRGTFE